MEHVASKPINQLTAMKPLFDSSMSFLAGSTPAALCQSFFVIAAAGVIAVAVAPPSARQLLTEYGARSSTTISSDADAHQTPDHDKFMKLISWATAVGRVPHSWFIHFYVLSISSSIFWAIQYLSHGSILDFIVKKQATGASTTMTLNQVFLTWTLMSMQGARRLYEYLVIIRPSSSRMWFVHWALGCAYYLCIGISVWVEGSEPILQSDRRSILIDAPSLKEVLGVPLFLSAWSMQYKCHKHLTGLKKYSLPAAGMFRHLICPHYTCECLLYLSLAIIAAPENQWYNKTLVCGLLFVSVNLGITAHSTRKWYAHNFGEDKVQSRWNMIPLVY